MSQDDKYYIVTIESRPGTRSLVTRGNTKEYITIVVMVSSGHFNYVFDINLYRYV